MSEHRVATHLGLAASDYDAAIRRYIPGYEAMIETVVAIVAALDAPYVIDLGAGTGALGAAILDRAPRARVRFLDIDPAMLAVAGARVAHHGDRAELHHGSFEERSESIGGGDPAGFAGGAGGKTPRGEDDALPACDAVVASLALHHVPERDRKRALYARVRDALRPGGVLLVADITVHEAGPAHTHGYAAWAAEMATHGIARADAEALFAKWAGEDRYYPLAVELALLAEAGFAAPECFWKHGPSTVFGAFR